MPRQITLQEWERKRAYEPANDADAVPPWVKRKLRLLVDEDIGAELVARLSRDKRFKIFRLRPGSSDADLWREARRRGAVLLTGNWRDFWPENQYRIQDCPGLIAVTGRTVRERSQAFEYALNESTVFEDNARWGTCRDMKIKATPTGKLQVKRYYQEGEIVVDNF